MPVKALWNGTLRVGEMALPCKVYKAVQNNAIELHLLHRGCGGGQARVTKIDVCEHCESTLSDSDLDRCYVADDGGVVTLPIEDVVALYAGRSKAIEVIGVLKEAQAPDAVYAVEQYYLHVDQSFRKPFALLRNALQSGWLVMLCKVAFSARGGERLAAIRPLKDRRMLLTTLRWPDEVRDDPEYHMDFLEAIDAQGTAKERQAMARMLRGLKMPFKPEDYRDEYQEGLRKLIEKRAEEQAAKRSSGC